MKLFTKVVWLYFVKVLSFPNLKTSTCALCTPRFLVTHDSVCIFSNFCGQNFVSREVTQRPRVKTKKSFGCRFMAFVFKFQFSLSKARTFFFLTRFFGTVQGFWKFFTRGSCNFLLVQLCLNTWIAECFVRLVWYAL